MRKEKFMKRTAAGMLILLFAIWGSSITSYAAQEKEVYVYHCHTGDEISGGGCYKEPVYHEHQGDETSGGKCYETPVYHVHTGNESAGGGCYQQPVYHVHEGDGTAPTACYTAVYHEHVAGCYKEVDYDSVGCHVINYWDGYGDDYTDASGKFHDYKYYEMQCGQTIYGTNAYHRHKVLNCKKEGTIEKYEVCCKKTPETVEGYAMTCGKTPQTVESYRLSCPKTIETIEKYVRSCQKEESSPCGIMRVSAAGEQNNQRAVLHVEFSDFTGGEILCRAEDFAWESEGGKALGRGTSVSVSENGAYSVSLSLSNENVTPRELCAGVRVDFIVKPTPPKQEENSSSVQSTPGQEMGDVTKNTPGPGIDNSGQGTDGGSPGIGTENGGKAQTITVIKEKPLVLPTIVPVVEEETEGELMEDELTEAERFHFPEKDLKVEVILEEPENGDEMFMISEKTEAEKEELLQEREEQVMVEVPGRQSEGGNIGEIQTLEQEAADSFWGMKVILLTAVILFVTLGLAAGIFFLWRSVAVYNDDGEGNLFYIGRSFVYREEDACVISITDKMREKSETNKYCIKPGLFLLGREREEIIIERGHKRISAELKKEMNIMI